jgi:molybdopterin-guanine dinucleotide biosynthesis protein B
VTLDELLAHLSPCDLVLVEGFKQEPIPKLEVYRPENGKPPLFPDRPDIVAVACDRADIATTLPAALNDIDAIADLRDEHPQLQARRC